MNLHKNLGQDKETELWSGLDCIFGSISWIPEQIVEIGEDFHSQIGDGKVKTTLYKVRLRG